MHLVFVTTTTVFCIAQKWFKHTCCTKRMEAIHKTLQTSTNEVTNNSIGSA